MRSIPPRQRSTLARRIAAGLSPQAAAKGSGLPAEDVAELVAEPEFDALVGAWSDIFALTPEARTERLRRLAHLVLEQRMQEGCGRTAAFVMRETSRRRDPVVTLAKGFRQLAELEQARAARQNLHAAAAPPGPRSGEPPPAEPSSPEPGPAAEPVAKLRLRPHPDDAMAWRKAGALRCDMLHEQTLFSSDALPRIDELWCVPLEPDEAAAIEARQVAAFAASQAGAGAEPDESAEAARAGQRRGRQGDPRAAGCMPESTDRPPPDDVYGQHGPPPTEAALDAAFNARAVAMFNDTLAQAPPEIRGLLATFSQQELWALVDRCWPKDDERGQAQPQAP